MNTRPDKATNTLKRNIFWGVFYVAILAVFSLATFLVTNQMQTHVIPNGQVELSIPYSKYLQGETVSFSIKNNFNSPIYVINACPDEPLAVYRLTGSEWVRIHDQASEGDCPKEQRRVSVAAGTTISGNFAHWHNLFSEPGRYRIVAYVENYNALPYQEIEVVAKPALAPGVEDVKTKTTTSVVEDQTPTTNGYDNETELEMEYEDD